MQAETQTTLKASELRIGNWIRYNDTKYIKDIQVNASSIFALTKSVSNFEPIPLTPELLEKAGFEYVAWKDMPKQGVHVLKAGRKEFRIELWREKNYRIFKYRDDMVFEDYTDLRVDVSYLHQLQNLFYCLTGEELEINL